MTKEQDRALKLHATALMMIKSNLKRQNLSDKAISELFGIISNFFHPSNTYFDMKRTANQSKIIYALLAKENLMHHKEDFALSYSDGRTTSTSELTFDEANNLIGYLQQGQKAYTSTVDSAVKIRRKIFHYCYLLGWAVYDKKAKREYVDYQKLDAWMLQYSYMKKKFREYKVSELPKLMQQFEQMFKATK